MSIHKKAQELLSETFGLKAFREGQKLIIESVLKKKDTLGIMPTGGGKSLCYQLPSLCFEGTTLVISPLISLMKDQIDFLHSKKLPAEMINSTVSYSRQLYIKEGVEKGQIKLLYLTPERFRNEKFIAWLQSVEISCFVIDEAHCISEWGHDFRPEYRRLAEVIKILGHPPVLALTATATRDVSRDIVATLHMKKPNVFISGFNRENLIYGLQNHFSKESKNKALLDFVKRVNKPGIVYTSSKKDAEYVYQFLRTNTGEPVGIYHGSLNPQTRKDMQDAFLNGRITILVATNAFGMGVNKRDIRFVVHYSIPGSIEAYYQETGRAGRDNEKSYCLLLYFDEDERIQNFFIETNNPPISDIVEVFGNIKNICKKELLYTNNLDALMTAPKFNTFTLDTIIKKLAFMGIITFEFMGKELIEIQVVAKKLHDADLDFLSELSGKNADKHRFFSMPTEFMAKRMGYPVKELMKELEDLKEKRIIFYTIKKKGRVIKVLSDSITSAKRKHYEQNREKKLAIDRNQFQAMVEYAHLETCRRKFLLQYFQESFEKDNCKACDICRDTYQGKDNFEWTPVRKSIIYFFIHHSDKIGGRKSIRILKGSGDIEPKYMNWDEYGKLKNLDIRDIESELNFLLKSKILEKSTGKYSVIKISNTGLEKIQEIT